jgi:tetratricopeptide (TPR) repeat protein
MNFQDDNLAQFAASFLHHPERQTFRQEWIAPELFDYSLASLEHVDTYLLSVREDNTIEQEDYSYLVLRCGAYVGEVIRHHSQTVDYHWLGYDDVIKISPDVEKFGKNLATAFALYYPPDTVWFPLARIEKMLQEGSESSVAAFADIMLNLPINVQPTISAHFLYEQVTTPWAEVVELSLYDHEEHIHRFTPLLEAALKADPNHKPSLELLGELLIMLGSYQEAKLLVERLIQIEPENEVHRMKHDLLVSLDPDNFDDCFELEYWLKEKWRTVDGW